jgi:hypothetical protein
VIQVQFFIECHNSLIDEEMLDHQIEEAQILVHHNNQQIDEGHLKALEIQ